MQIELRSINKHFGTVHANNNISLTFTEGRIIGILGENGAGKSTLMKILSGYQPPTSGDILIDGNVVDYHDPLAAIANGIGMLQQDPLDVGAFTVLENFVFGREPMGLIDRWFHKKAPAREQLRSLTAQFGFKLDADMLIGELSIAQRQQLEIIRLLSQNVRTLILDEPTTGISADQKDLLFSILREMANGGMTILLVSHKLEDVIALCDEVAVLRAGEIVGEREMPATKGDLVALMFGEELPVPVRERKQLDHQPVVLEVQDARLASGRLQMNDINIAVRAGEVIGLAGLDGSGQELLMRAAAALHPLEQGKRLLKGDDVSGKTYHDLFEADLIYCAAGRVEEGLIAGLTLTDHVALTEGQGMMIDWQQIRQSTVAKINAYDVRGRPDNAIEELSGGNQQRVLMSLIDTQPAVMLLEQPTRGLDVDSAAGIWEKLLQRCANGAALIFSSPELDEILTYSDRIIVCYAGETYLVNDPAAINSTQLGHMIGGEFER